jgi:uncharacterized protein (TIGR02757 family)
VKRKPPRLRESLALLASRYDRQYLRTDPVWFPRQYRDRADRECVAFLAASLAYGSVPQIFASVRRVLEALDAGGPSPARAIDRVEPAECQARLGGFQHRFSTARDVACLLGFVRQMRARSGSIEGFFAEAPEGALRDRLSSFCRRALELDTLGLYGPGPLPADAGVRFFFCDPRDGSACKRLCMFLRWMVRPDDGVDMGLWSCVSTAELVMPLDTHTTRISFLNGLCPSRGATWRNAERVTAALRRFDAADPVRFDFALSRLGILKVRGAEARVRVKS